VHIYAIHPIFPEFLGKSNKIIIGECGNNDKGYILDGHHYLYKCLKEGLLPTIEYKEINERTKNILEALYFCFCDLYPLVNEEDYEIDNFQFHIFSFNYSYKELTEILEKYSKNYHLASQVLSFVMKKQMQGIGRYEDLIDADYTEYLKIIWQASVEFSIQKGIDIEIRNIEVDKYDFRICRSPTELEQKDILKYKKRLMKDINEVKITFFTEFLGELREELDEICEELVRDLTIEAAIKGSDSEIVSNFMKSLDEKLKKLKRLNR